jgi:hypothetical protein
VSRASLESRNHAKLLQGNARKIQRSGRLSALWKAKVEKGYRFDHREMRTFAYKTKYLLRNLDGKYDSIM